MNFSNSTSAGSLGGGEQLLTKKTIKIDKTDEKVVFAKKDIQHPSERRICI
jgi:hypothetical protein